LCCFVNLNQPGERPATSNCAALISAASVRLRTATIQLIAFDAFDKEQQQKDAQLEQKESMTKVQRPQSRKTQY
jgi:hypothetical protein